MIFITHDCKDAPMEELRLNVDDVVERLHCRFAYSVMSSLCIESTDRCSYCKLLRHSMHLAGDMVFVLSSSNL